MKILSTFITIVLLSCSNSAESTNKTSECLFKFNDLSVCEQSNYKVSLQTTPIAPDEIKLQGLRVTFHGKQQLLNVSEDTSLLEGDTGIISFNDINFDDIPDIAISTSFGLANLYMDYWIFDKKTERFVKVGNYVQFKLHPAKGSLSNTVKVNATTYENNEYLWADNNLIKK